jgi:Domain of unknown function (DUF4129)
VRSRPELVLLLGALGVLAAHPALAAPPAQARSAAAPGAFPTEADIEKALEKLRADPNLGAERTIKTLKWAGKNKKKPKEQNNPGMEWLIGLVSWIGSAGRLVLWVAGGLLVVLLALYLTRFLRSREPREKMVRHVAPTHVRDMDIRPESLPADIGAAAWVLWERSEQRASLSLLYRGLLSRLAHVHTVPIRDSSTEGECLRLAQRHLSEQRSQYVSHLIRVWQQAVYGGIDPDPEAVKALCEDFSAALDASGAARLAVQPA